MCYEKTYKASLRADIRAIEATKEIRELTDQEALDLETLYDKLDSHQSYLAEAGMAYES